MRTIRECRVHGHTEHGAQNRCLLCKKGRSASYRERVLPTLPVVCAVKLCERPGCHKPAVMWKKSPRWCGHTDRVWCLYRTSKRAKVTS
jgi:hypothetical protein